MIGLEERERFNCNNLLKTDKKKVNVFLLGFSTNVIVCNRITLYPLSDQDRISPYDVNTISSRQAMRIKKNIN